MNRRFPSIEVGDKVAYSKSFLQSTGQYTGDVPHARGTVTRFKVLGDITLAEVLWNIVPLGDGTILSCVNTANLVTVENIPRESD